MKKSFVFILMLAFLLGLTGCGKVVKFEAEEKCIEGFHRINVAEEMEDGILYLNGEELLYEKEDSIVTLAKNVQSVWREERVIYYTSDNVLYNYSFETKETNVMVKKPYHILGKYKETIISYHGKNIYAIKGTQKTKIFEDGYYLNKAVLYGNKVYGIPATNVYEYNLDTLEVKKITNHKHDLCDMTMSGNQFYINTIKHKNEKNSKNDYTYFAVTDKGVEEAFSIQNIYHVSAQKNIKNGVVLATENSFEGITDGNQLLYAVDGELNVIDEGYSYQIIGVFENKLLYYKNNDTYGEGKDNLNAFYLYDGKESKKAFELDTGFYETITGYEYEGGIFIAIMEESSTEIYQYDGKTIERLDTPSIYRINGLDVIDGKIYLKYSSGEEDSKYLAIVIE